MTAVFCPCREPAKLEESSVPTLVDRDECYFSLNCLLFCKRCRSIRCPYCTVNEPISWFCSQCLQETTKLGAREAFNKCLRNCLRCPMCKANAIIRTSQGDSVTVRCSSCEYSRSILKAPNMTLGAQIMNSNLKKLQKINLVIDHHLVNTKIPHSAGPLDTEPVSDSLERLPDLVSLRAKHSKFCAACGEQLALPSKHPTQVKYELKSLARAVLPEIEMRIHNNRLYLLAWNRSLDDMVVKIANLDADVTVPSELHIPSKTTEGFHAPLFLVFRESLESRQAFMTGKKDAKSGPGWALGEASVPQDAGSILLFTSTACGTDSPIGAWIKVSVREC